MHALLHGIELLLLIFVQHGLDGVVGSLHDASSLGAAIFGSGGLVQKKSLHLLLAFDEKRLDLRLLIRCQVEFAREALKLAIGVHAHAAPVRAFGGGCGLVLVLTCVGGRGRGVLGESGTGGADGEQAAKGQRE